MTQQRDQGLIVELGLEERVKLLLENEAMKKELAAYHAKEAAEAAMADKRKLPGFANWPLLGAFQLKASNGLKVHVYPAPRCRVEHTHKFVEKNGTCVHWHSFSASEALFVVYIPLLGPTNVVGKLEHIEGTSNGGDTFRVINLASFPLTLGDGIKTIAFECNGLLSPQSTPHSYELISGVQTKNGISVTARGNASVCYELN